MVNTQSVKKNQKEAHKLLEILGKCNAWSSGIRANVTSECTKIETQMIQQNHMELSKVRKPPFFTHFILI